MCLEVIYKSKISLNIKKDYKNLTKLYVLTMNTNNSCNDNNVSTCDWVILIKNKIINNHMMICNPYYIN